MAAGMLPLPARFRKSSPTCQRPPPISIQSPGFVAGTRRTSPSISAAAASGIRWPVLTTSGARSAPVKTALCPAMASRNEAQRSASSERCRLGPAATWAAASQADKRRSASSGGVRGEWLMVAASLPRVSASRQREGSRISSGGLGTGFAAADGGGLVATPARTASPAATAWPHNAPLDWFSGHGQRVSRSVADFTITLTRSGRLPLAKVPRQPLSLDFASVTAPLSNSALPSLKAFQEAAVRRVCSFHPLMPDGCLADE